MIELRKVWTGRGFVALTAVVGLAAALVGASVAASGAARRAAGGDVVADGWRSWSGTGGAERDRYARAAVAFRGIFAMRPSEALYFVRDTDERGRPLREGCVYELVGGPQAARWWSLSLYAGGETFADNADGAHSVDATTVAASSEGLFRIVAGPDRRGAANWLSTHGAGPFMLMLRLYGPKTDRPLAPAIRTVACDGGSAP